MTDEWRQLKPVYRTGTDSLGTSFFKPCFRGCVAYRRAAGFFSSSALVSWAEAFKDSHIEQLRLDLLISPELSEADGLAFERATTIEGKAQILTLSSDKLIEHVLSDPNDDRSRADFLVWLVASGKLTIQFALPKHIRNPGMFHQKSGVFTFADGSKVGFDGSANETASGYDRNYESVQVFRSWAPADGERLTLVEEELNSQWSGLDDQLIVVPLSEASLELIRTRARTLDDEAKPKPTASPDTRWAHQLKAAEAFVAERRGILEMATGTGKTKTALQIAKRLFDSGAVDSIIVSTDGSDLLQQWFEELLDWRNEVGLPLALYRHFGSEHQGMTFSLRPKNSILAVSRGQLHKFLPIVSPEQAQRTLVVHDEVHGLGAPSLRESLNGQHQRFGYVLGLSATPDREYDAEGTAFIEKEIGSVVFRFGLEDAIKKGILVEFDYVPLPYELTVSDRARLKAVYSRQAARQAEGRPMSQEELWTELSRVYKTAEQKPGIFADYLQTNPNILKGCILFVEEREYGEQVLPILHSTGWRYRTYYADDDRENLILFGRGEIDCVITCHKISQGIDIRSLQSVVLFSSARARLETIQRVGRCLRSDPTNTGKRAVVVDFVLEPREGDRGDSADAMRRDWLDGLSKIRRDANAH